MTGELVVWGLEGLPEVRQGDDLATMLAATAPDLRDGDVIVLTSKAVSKAEGRIRTGDRETAIDAETSRVVARRGATRIVQTRHGFVLAAAGVDASNTDPGTVVLLPDDPDASARRIRSGIRERLGVTVAVVISDSFGRPWRNGLTDVALGLAGIEALDDLRGQWDTHGNPLDVTVTAVADEITGAADLVKGKLSGVPAAVVRGLAHRVSAADGKGVCPILRPADEDMFRYGSRDVVTARRTVREFSDAPVDPEALRRAVGAAITAPAPGQAVPSRFVLLESADARKRLLDAIPDSGTAELHGAPQLVVPCLASGYESAHARGEREALIAAMGASIENLLVALAAEGLGSSWRPSLGPEVVRRELGLPPMWEPMGTVGIGYPATSPPERPPLEPDDFLIRR